MPDETNQPIEKQEAPNTEPQMANPTIIQAAPPQTVNTNPVVQPPVQSTPNNPGTIPSTQGNKNGGKNFIFNAVMVIVILVVAALFVFSIKGLLLKSKQDNTGTAQYQAGYPIDHVTIQMPNDELLQRYPVIQPTIVGLNTYVNTFEGLTVFRGPNLIEPGLAVSWTNPNPTTWRFSLRKGVHFQSGDLFTAKDVKYTIDQCKANATWICQTMADQIDHVNIINDYTVDLITTEPNATLINSLYFIGMLSQAQVARNGLNNDVGTGPYKIVSIASRSAELTANNNYWGGAPKVKNLKYIVITDPNKAVQSLENGSTDIIFLNDEGNHNDLLGKGFYESDYNTGGIDYITFDVNSVKSKKYVNTPNNPFHDSSVRQAIYLALNVPQMVSNIKIDADPVNQFATTDLVGYNPSIKSPVTNITQAKKLLAQAGFPNGFSVVFDSDDIPAHVQIVNQIKKQLALIGITIKPEVPDTTDLYNRIAAGDYSMLITWYYPDTLDSRDMLDTLFHTPEGSHGLWNPSNISDPKLDSMLDQAESTYDINKRIELTQETQALVMKDLYQIPLYTENYQIFARDNVSFKTSINMLISGIDLSGRQQVASN